MTVPANTPASTAEQAFRCRARLALAVVLTLACAPVAWAQVGSGPIGTTGHASGRENLGKEKPPEPPPEAIPGAKAREPAAPATRPVGDMSPNDALFDAINRGDIAAARDALNRGADLNAVNVLGMTPMEVSVDLGRNDISFLLLSMRGDEGSRGTPAASRTPAAPSSKAGTVHAGRPARPTRPAKPTVAASSKPTATPKLFANDGGSAIPSVGFLGFDSRSASN